MKSYVIHMTSATARRVNAERLLRDLPGATWVEAVDGRDPAQVEGVETRPGDLFSPAYPFPLRAPEVGVFLSHRRCWEALVASGEDFALIVEDDLKVEPDSLARALNLIATVATAEMYVRLPVKQREVPARVLGRDGDMELMLPRRIGLQCIAQVVGRGAAARLLAVTEVIDRPVDTLLQMHWATGQPIHALLPNGNREVAAQIGGSTIQTKVRGRAKLAREARRALYRARVAARPQT